MQPLTRRRLVASLLLPGLPLPALAQTPDAAAALRAGGCAVVLRHSQTTPGVGDPPGYRLDMCVSQRNLSDAGRAQARRLGDWFRARQLRPQVVKSSHWCRCKETATLAFGRHLVWPALNNIFDDRSSEPEQMAALRAALPRIPAGRFEVWVTHGVVIQALCGQSVAMGEGLVLDASGSIMARTTFG